jgi:hypothetical protein
MTALWARGIPWAGLALGPGAWIVSTQANYAAVPWICATRINFIPVFALTLILVALAGALLSWRSYRIEPEPPTDGAGGVPRHLLAFMSVLLGLLFALVIATQGAAALVLTGCER